MFDKINSILVVDDSAVQRQHALSLLQSMGATALSEAANGQEALVILTNGTALPALMLLDLEMPGMDGVELLQQLQKQAIDIPVVILSSREQSLLSSIDAMVKNTNMRVLAIVPKPLNEEKLRQAVKSYSDQPAAPVVQKVAQVPLTEDELAMVLNDHAIVAYFQPKVDIRTGMLKGVEALARIQHDTLGFVSPDRFIPVAEQCGLIHDLTLEIIEQAMAQCALWNSRGLVLKVAINLSALSLDIPGFIDKIVAIQTKHGVTSDQFVFEITESVVVSNVGNTLGMLARLRLKGFGLSIDDYGTGFSSMQQLAMLPFTELKIDRAFVNGAHEKQNSRVILQSALDMAQRLSLVSVAEGIETMDDWRLLQDFNCVIGQGYLIGKPMKGDDIPVWLKAHHQRLPELRSR
jgi:EAL domain-containing protein (putative c-di-GMP-specific phosphodiesterase class I)